MEKIFRKLPSDGAKGVPSLNRMGWVKLGLVLLVFGCLLFVQPYATGYFEERDPLFKDILQGFKRDGGEWGFGYFVPLIVGLLFYLKRHELMSVEVKPSAWLGLPVLIVGFVIYFGGYKANVTYGGYLALQILLAGACFWFLGLRWFLKCFWLWCLFGMMWPNVFLIQPISTPLRKMMVALTSRFLDLIGVDALRNGMAIMTDTPDPLTGEPIVLSIAQDCSGLRSLFALVMIGFVFAAFALRSEWHRWVLMATIPLVAVAGNFVRMLMLYFGSKFFGTTFAIGEGEGNESFYHIASGLVVFVVALTMLSAFVEILKNGLQRFFKKKKVMRTNIEKAS